MEILPIDFDKTLKEISEWHDQWKEERFGSDSLNPREKDGQTRGTWRYHNKTSDGRYLYGVAEGESLNDEKADSDKVLELLVRIKNINDRLKGKGLSQHLQWKEREQLKGEREGLYKEFLDEVQADIEKQQPEPQQEQIKPTRRKGRPTEPFASKMINDSDGKKLKKIHTISQGKMGKDFALIIWACIEKGWCNKPTYTQVRKEFGNIGSSTGYNRYLSNGSRMFTQQEKDGVLKSLD